MTDFLIRCLAVFYTATAVVDLSETIKKYVPSPWKTILSKKPFNCVFCLSFWLSPLGFIPRPYILIPAVAGGSVLLAAIRDRLQTFFAIGD